MSKIRVSLVSVKALEGQGIGEGNFELEVVVTEGKNRAVRFETVDQGGQIKTLNETVATYEVGPNGLSKSFVIDVTERDKGTLGQDDTGQETVTLALAPGMSPLFKTVAISLKGPNQKPLGKVEVKLLAQVA